MNMIGNPHVTTAHTPLWFSHTGPGPCHIHFASAVLINTDATMMAKPRRIGCLDRFIPES